MGRSDLQHLRRARIVQVAHGIEHRAPLDHAHIIRVVAIAYHKAYAAFVLQALERAVLLARLGCVLVPFWGTVGSPMGRLEHSKMDFPAHFD